jgi:electron transfer flavoprotein alpha subunit
MEGVMENKKILIYAELKGGSLEASAYEFLAKARALFPAADAAIALAIAGCGIDAALKEAAVSGADLVYGVDSPRLELYHVDYHAEALKKIAETFRPDIFLIPASCTGEELAPTLGLKLRTGVAAHCVDLQVDQNGEFLQMVPAFGGKVIGEIYTPKTKPQIASIKPGMFSDIRQQPRSCKTVLLDDSFLEELKTKIKLRGIEKEEPSGVPVEQAEVVVCGGFGIENADNWKQVERLAGLLGGAAGSTRPAVDQGWVSGEQQMIGTSGKTVRPKVYIGAGVSGATHHICGMKDSNVIISINTDKDAEIFTVSDYKIVSDGAAVVKALCELLERRQ